jgi:hypothetical protein
VSLRHSDTTRTEGGTRTPLCFAQRGKSGDCGLERMALRMRFVKGMIVGWWSSGMMLGVTTRQSVQESKQVGRTPRTC